MIDSFTVEVFSTISFVIGCISLFFGLATCVLLKDVEPLINRSKLLSAIIWIGLIDVLFQTYMASMDLLVNCYRSIIWRFLLPNPIPGLALRALALYRAHLYHSKAIRDAENDKDLSSEQISDSKKRRDSSGWRVLIKPYILFQAIQISCQLCGIIWAKLGNRSFDDYCVNIFNDM